MTINLDGDDVCGFVFVILGVVIGSGKGRRMHQSHQSLNKDPHPRPFQPPPLQTLVDCGVVEVDNLVVWSKLTTQRQNGLCYLPPPNTKSSSQIPSKV